MPLEFWILLWKAVFVIAVVLFAALAVVVTVGGAFDVGRLLKTLREEHARAAAETQRGEETSGSASHGRL